MSPAETKCAIIASVGQPASQLENPLWFWRHNNTMHTEPRAARVFLLASRSPRPGDRCRYPALLNLHHATMTNNEDCTIDQLASDGRMLLQNRDGIDAHRSFNLWVNCVADWLDEQFPDSGKSATWSGLAASTLVSGRHFYDNPPAWQTFHDAVRQRLSWLGQLRPARGLSGDSNSPKCETLDVFVVHGHDNEFKLDVARTLSQLGLSPIILHERPNRGQTIIAVSYTHLTLPTILLV